jgi:hypothetical protein
MKFVILISYRFYKCPSRVLKSYSSQKTYYKRITNVVTCQDLGLSIFTSKLDFYWPVTKGFVITKLLIGLLTCFLMLTTQ